MVAPHAALCALLALTCARAEIYRSRDDFSKLFHSRRSIQPADSAEVRGCMYAGRWFAVGASVRMRDSCLRCRCAHGALSCARAACAPTPDPPPRRCAVLHRHSSCCPELHCPDGVRSLELDASARIEEESWDVATPAAPGHACVEEGAVFAAGSALATRAACEQCFCLRGARRCVRPRCLPPAPGCAPRPAPGACCPSRYYCEKPTRDTTSTTPAPVSSATVAHRQHDCQVNGKWVSEGEQVAAGTIGADNCTQCFCLRGGVLCQPMACAHALHGCEPLLRPGQCCPHQYRCPQRHSNDHLDPMAPIISTISDNSLISTRNDERSFRTSASTKSSFVAETAAANISATQTVSATHPATTKVKRKTSDSLTTTANQKTTLRESNDTFSKSTSVTATTPTASNKSTSPKTTSSKPTTSKSTSPKGTSSTTSPKDTSPKILSTPANFAEETTTETNLVSSTETITTARPIESTSTEQPESSVKIIVNGTINCTAELSSTLTNTTLRNATDNIDKELKSQTSEKSNLNMQATTLEPMEIITDRDIGAGFAEGDSFIINVTSSLNANSSRVSPHMAPPVLKDITHTSNMSKKTKEDYDYDYTEPTLPPSLPNLKIIPFVAADAVVDDVPAKEETLSYPIMEREDKFPVYYPNIEQKKTAYATRREDVYNPTQYPVFVSEAEKRHQLIELPLAVEKKKPATRPPTTTTTRQQTVPTPEVNLFSPPAETEGGFVPKGPGIIDEYYAVYPSTPAPVPHLTTSMQINPDSPDKVQCVTHDGRRVPEGESVWLACSVCACAWGELHCAPRRCPPPPPGCRRRPATASSADLCCGEISCKNDSSTTPNPMLSIRRTEITLNVTKIPIETGSDLIPFDPPPDRSVPELSISSDVNQDEGQQKEEHVSETAKLTTPVPIAFYNSTSMPIGETGETLATTTTTPDVPSSSETPLSSPTTSTPTSTLSNLKVTNYTDSQSQEYEDDDDEGFSFGSVLKLLLSDNYDTTTNSPTRKKMTTLAISSPSTITTSFLPKPSTTRRPTSKPAIPPFIPVQTHAYIPPKSVLPPNSVNRIDHLVLGEATAIKKSTARPTTTPFRPMSSPVRRITTRTTTRKPTVTIRTTTIETETEEVPEYTPSIETARPVGASGGGVGGTGLLKLAGCNIYGRMYRVGRIIAELSTPCQECRCTEVGVQCLPLRC